MKKEEKKSIVKRIIESTAKGLKNVGWFVFAGIIIGYASILFYLDMIIDKTTS